jgi:hypothetical protein
MIMTGREKPIIISLSKKYNYGMGFESSVPILFLGFIPFRRYKQRNKVFFDWIYDPSSKQNAKKLT